MTLKIACVVCLFKFVTFICSTCNLGNYEKYAEIGKPTIRLGETSEMPMERIRSQVMRMLCVCVYVCTPNFTKMLHKHSPQLIPFSNYFGVCARNSRSMSCISHFAALQTSELILRRGTYTVCAYDSSLCRRQTFLVRVQCVRQFENSKKCF